MESRATEGKITDLQSHPFPGGPAMGWWSYPHGPTPVETQSHPCRSPFLVASPSISVESKEQPFISILFWMPLLSLWSCVIFSVPPFPLLFRVSKVAKNQSSADTRVLGPALPYPDLRWLILALCAYLKIEMLCSQHRSKDGKKCIKGVESNIWYIAHTSAVKINR